eukprot:CAMPEP_0169323448 /NCGR_PEP_ID=MMETSP1017-20121227/9955_1 /TAXON_ID=342587 /ORGANISM="Karlodinium micrum, Strain CCMP2283" /LENGTH=339 /DNA_ID=CAMNT_0009418051 /DNA_START=15 /DNA_END=1031 /DNA_ORIENTATION=-
MDQQVMITPFADTAPQKVESDTVAVDGVSATSPDGPPSINGAPLQAGPLPAGPLTPGISGVSGTSLDGPPSLNGAPLQAGPLPVGPLTPGINGASGFVRPPAMQSAIGNFDGAAPPHLSTGSIGNSPGFNSSGNFEVSSENFGGFPSMPMAFGGPPMRPPGDQTRYRGTVTTYDQVRGSGTIDSVSVRTVYNSDVFFLVGALRGRDPHVGMELEFCVINNPENGPQACNVSFPHPGSSPPSIPPGIAPAPGDPAAGRFLGVIKSFNSQKGWGHIESHEARAIFGRDIFLLRSTLRGADVGAGNQVEFTVNNAPKGPMARDVCFVDYGPTMPEAERYRAN